MSVKYTLLSVLLVVFCVIGCKTSNAPVATVGMFKVAILYPNEEGKSFDMDYYEKTHMPMVAALLGDNLKFYEIDKGVAGRTPNDKLPFVAVGYFYIQNVADYGKAIAENREVVLNDIKKYTDIQPIINISEIRQLVVKGK